MSNPAVIFGQRPVVRFLLILGVLIAIFYAVTLSTLFRERVFRPLTFANAQTTAMILTLLGYEARSHQESINSPRFSVDLRRGCDAIEPTALFAAAVLAVRVPFIAKLLGILGGVVILQFTNLIRILTLFFAGIYWPSAFEILHVDVWQPLFIALTVALWTMWALWAMKPRVRATEHAPA